jgi:ABC-type multidrug transport system ATPase subunit/ABC-type transporter Mla maintaining outer membrane lipid asymmetry permease subunit MlaE
MTQRRPPVTDDAGSIPGPILRVSNLSLAPGAAAALLDHTGFELQRGEVVLLTGPSGCGKSTLVNLLAGTLDTTTPDWQVSGTVDFEGASHDLAHERSKIGGMVFQNFALFDDLTAAQNVEIAFDHSGRDAATYAEPVEKLLQGIDPSAAVRDCSGGQQQRIAIARTLVADKSVLFMDEPNSGLDNAAATELARIIRELADHLGLAIVVIAHHLDAFRDIADRLLVIDTATGEIKDLGKPRPAIVDAALHALGDAATESVDTGRSTPRFTANWATDTCRSPAVWQARFFGYYFWLLCLSPSILLFIGLGGILVGFVSTSFIFQYFPYRDILVPVIQNDALAGIGYVQFRLLIPLVVSILIATRNGAIISADIGSRVYSSQPWAMGNLGIPYRRYIPGNITLSLMLGTPVLCLAAMAISAWFSMQTWHAMYPEQSAYFWREHYFREIWPLDHSLPVGLFWVLAKILPSALCANLISIYFGSRPKKSVTDVNSAIANSIIFSVSFVFLWHSLVILYHFHFFARG